MSVERPRRLPPGMKAPPPRPPGNPRKGFAFPHAQGVTLRSPQKWSCPNCGGDCFGSGTPVEPGVTTYYCTGASLGTQTEQTQGCGYWETAYEPRRQGIRKR